MLKRLWCFINSSLSELDGIFAVKQEQKVALRAFLGEHVFALLLASDMPLRFAPIGSLKLELPG